MSWLHPRRRALLRGGVFSLVGGTALIAIFILSGFYNVGASVRHLYITDRIIKLVLHRSVALHSRGTEVPDLSSDGLADLGRRHFETGCAPCHAGPNSTSNPIVSQMYPAPPPLRDALGNWSTAEVFWIVKNGLKFTGMPAWPGENRNDEVWALTAYLEQLRGRNVDAANLTAEAPELEFGEAGGDAIGLCTSCHGDETTLPPNELAPSLNGQSAAYLRRALNEYRTDVRQSGMMEPIAATLGDEEIDDLSRHFSELKPHRAPAAHAPTELAAEGVAIARNGIQTQQLPACLSCHGQDASDQFPRLEGLSGGYIANQLTLWRQGQRDESGYGAIMATIARRLEPEQINAVSAYFEAQTPPQAPSVATRDAEADQ